MRTSTVSKLIASGSALGAVALLATCASSEGDPHGTGDTAGSAGTAGRAVGSSGSTAGGTAGTSVGTAGDADSLPTCDDALKQLDLGRDTTITLARRFGAGDQVSLASPAGSDALVATAEVCLVKMVVGPGNPGPSGASSTSGGIGIEVWLPTREHWNGRYQAIGGGGWQGGLGFTSLTEIASQYPTNSAGIDAVSPAMQGFVTSLNDSGHSIEDGSFAMNPDGTLNEPLLHDFAERSSHEMALETKALIRAYYGKDAEHSYWNGCSTGGRQGLMEVQRYPEDFDGVLTAAPAIHWDRFTLAELWPQLVMQLELGGPIAGAKLALATMAAIAACDARSTGNPDGYVSDPAACRYDPTLDPGVLCASAGGNNDTAACLSAAEATAINKIWYGPTVDGRVPAPSEDNGFDRRGRLAPGQLWFGLARGTLLSGQPLWDGLAGDKPFPVATDQVALVLGDAAYAQTNFENETGSGMNEWQTLAYAQLPELFSDSDERFGELLATDNADLTPFAKRGGKLMIWHGTADTLIFPQGSIHYYERVAEAAGGYEQAQEFARLYLAPGIDHCFGAGVPGTSPPETTNPALMDQLIAWVEDGVAPSKIPAGERSWCLYPETLAQGDGAFTCTSL